MFWLVEASTGSAGQSTGTAERIQAHLAAGEFSLALEAARSLADPAQRNQWLEQIALAQAQAGAQQAAYHSLRYISDSEARSQALQKLLQQPVGGPGGGVQPDFDSLIRLITSTVRPSSWSEVGGPGAVTPFPTGVLIDAQGLLQRASAEDLTGRLAFLRQASRSAHLQDNARRPSPLRKISLPRLEREVQLYVQSGLLLPEELQVLAGLQRIEYIFVYPEEQELVLAGPAGPWHSDAHGHLLSDQTGLPVVRLEDLVVVFRHTLEKPDARFGCNINPTEEGLRRLRQYLDQTKGKPLRPGQQQQWLAELRNRLGRQKIEVNGLDPRTRTARILVEADYHMKLIGMGLAEPVPGLRSYLDLIEVPKGMAPPPMEVLRWWFTLHYEAVLASPDRLAYHLQGQGIRVLSENELLTAEGRRVHTGQAEPTNRLFAKLFTEHLEDLARKYPVYGELRNIADLAVVAALIRNERLAEQVGWKARYFLDPAGYPVSLGPAPTEVESVVNSREFNRRYILAGVSGGVWINPAELLKPGSLPHDYTGKTNRQHTAAVPPPQLPVESWWWD
ncbi:MAG: DUF1598 domain-containing protein [Thermoguttaceae bacterium]|nr:DUF1598 domain-containing protein [Thermoguttaceae bacterium]MDW8037110.1 DUF1598 domain-containing protein [Thermoguttaceae bacterium]